MSVTDKKDFGAAGHGAEHFWRQRLTALANLPLIGFLAVSAALAAPGDYQAARSWVADPLTAPALLLFIVSASWHMRLGMQVIIDDYVHSPALRVAAHIGNHFFAVATGFIAALSVLRLFVGR